MQAHGLDRLSLLRQVGLFRAFDDTQLRQFTTVARETTFTKGDHIFYQDDPGNCMFIIVSGYVRIYLCSQNGDEVTFRIYKSEDTFGEFAMLDGKPRTAGAEALSDVVALVLYRDDFMRLIQASFPMAQRIIEDLVERLRFTTNFVRNLAFLSATGRVAALLVQLATREGGGPGPVRIKITQDELAQAAGATREWINKALRTLAEEKQPLIQTERGAITVLDRARLQLWAESKERRGQERETTKWTIQTSTGRAHTPAKG